MSAVKSAAKLAAAAGALTMGVAAAVYEGGLNIKFSKILGEKLNFTDAENLKLYEDDYYTSCMNWLESKQLDDSVIADENNLECHALVLENENPSNNWVILCHGFTSEPLNMCNFAKEYYDMGYNCIMPSMRGHSKDTAKYCSMGYYDKLIVKAWARYIVLKNPSAKIIIHGVSMGAATTMCAIGEKDIPSNVLAGISDCGYTNLCEQYTDVIKTNAGLPPFPLLPAMNAVSKIKRNFDFREVSPVDCMATTKTPMLFIHGNKDTFVPYRMMDELYNACSSEKEKLTIEGARHAVSSIVDRELYWRTVKAFLNKHIS